MSGEPRCEADYNPRQVRAAHRALVDLGQVLASFRDCLVVVGGWVPDLLLAAAAEPHIGSIDVDFALDAGKLSDGRYAELLKLLLDTKRYKQGPKEFQLLLDVDLEDGGATIQVPVDFLAAKDVKFRKHRPRRVPGFRVLKADACGTAFHAPQDVSLAGKMARRGAKNTVLWRVASLPDFLVMKAHVLSGREKPKDAYDLCFVLEHAPAPGVKTLAGDWAARRGEKDVAAAIKILGEKFADVHSYGPRQLVEFHDSADRETQEMQAQRAFQLVQKFLGFLQPAP